MALHANVKTLFVYEVTLTNSSVRTANDVIKKLHVSTQPAYPTNEYH
jgi:hypothetical protein